MTQDILAFMEDPYDLNLVLVAISEEDHVWRDRKTPNPLSNFRTGGPDFTGSFSEQLTLGSDSDNHL